MNNIAIIPARSGSKEIKDKNIQLFNGKPLMAYTIEAANKSGIFQQVIVSTDSLIYAEIAKEYGAIVPFLRSKEFATDIASPWEAVKEILKYEKSNNKDYKICALLQPTSPLRKDYHILEAFNCFIEKEANAVVSVCEVEHPIQWCFQLESDGNMNQFSNSRYRNTRRQDITTHFRENGAIYLVKSDLLMNNRDIYAEKCFGYVMKKEYSIDIDTKYDFEVAEILYNKWI